MITNSYKNWMLELNLYTTQSPSVTNTNNYSGVVAFSSVTPTLSVFESTLVVSFVSLSVTCSLSSLLVLDAWVATSEGLLFVVAALVGGAESVVGVLCVVIAEPADGLLFSASVRSGAGMVGAGSGDDDVGILWVDVCIGVVDSETFGIVVQLLHTTDKLQFLQGTESKMNM